MTTAIARYKILCPAFALLYIFSCKSTSDVPFPENETEYAAPVARHFKFGEPKKIKWEAESPDSVKPITETKVDLDKLPSQPFDTGGFKPFTTPMTETKIDWNHLPDTAFSYKNLPVQKLRFTTSVLGNPSIVKIGRPHITDSAISNILVLDQGLPGYFSGAMIHDSKGILWIGTGEGLVRFDGDYFSIYGRDQGVEASAINKLSEDRNGQIWIGKVDGGVEIIDPKAGIIKHLTTKEGLSNDQIWGLLADKTGQVWIGSWGGGVDIVNEKEGTLRHLDKSQGLSDNYVRSFLEESNGNIWVGTGGGADIIDVKAGKITYLDMTLGLSDNNIESLIENEAGEIWIGTRNQLNIVNEKSGLIRHLSTRQGLSGNYTFHFLKDDYGQIWIHSSGRGIDIINQKQDMIRHIGMKEGLSNKYISGFIKGNQNHIWISTGTDLNLFDLNETFRYIHVGQPIDYSNINGYLEDRKGKIWAGTDSGVYIIDQNLKTYKNLKIDKGVNGIMEDSRGRVWMTEANDPKGLHVLDPGSGIMKYINVYHIASVFEDSNHDIWFGTYNGGQAGKISGKDFSISHINTGQDLRKTTVYPQVEDKQGQIWMGLYEAGIDVIDQKQGTFRQLSTANGFGDMNLIPFLEDSLHRVWVRSGASGIYMINQADATFTNFSEKQGMPDNYGINLKTKGREIFALTPRGLTILSPSGNLATADKWQLTTYSNMQGVKNYDIESYILLTKGGQLWWGNNNLFTIMQTRQKDTVKPHTSITGIDIINQPRYFVNNQSLTTPLQKQDTLWDHPKDTFYLNGQLTTNLNYYKKNNIVWDSVTGGYNLPVNLKLPYDQNYLTFHFNGTEPGDFSKTVYRYFLEGIDINWSIITVKPSSETYMNLPSGDYTFKVCSKGFNGLWSQPAEFSFSILPPWWKTWWAYTFYALLFAATVWAFTMYRSRNLKRQNKLLEEKVRLRTEELNTSLNELKSTQSQLIQSEKMASLGELTAGIAHEIQNPLNFVNNFSEVNKELIDELEQEADKGNICEVKTIAKDIRENEQKINHHGKRADAIVKGMLQHSRTSTGQKEPTDINALADEYLRLSYHGLRAKDKTFNVTLQTDFDKGIGKINIVPQDIGRVLLNLYNNAFYAVSEKKKSADTSYSPALLVSTKKTDNKITITVKDNGNGIPQKVVDKIFQPFFTTKPTGQGTGLGLSLSYDIIKAHGGEIKAETKENEGAEFTIILSMG